MKNFLTRLVNGALIVGLLLAYNNVIVNREKDDAIAKLNAELETANLLQQSLMQVQAAEVQSGDYADGIYSGEAEGFGGPVKVDVLIANGNIEEINVTSAEKEDGAYLNMAKDIIPTIIDAQSSDVDTISGATFSSTGIKNAVTDALEQAGN